MMKLPAKLAEAIRQIAGRLIAEYAPRKIVLFGSCAHGLTHADSDIDLLIIKATRDRLGKRLDTVRQLVQGTHPRIPFDPIVLTPAEVRRRLERGDAFLETILREGEVLHEV